MYKWDVSGITSVSFPSKASLSSASFRTSSLPASSERREKERAPSPARFPRVSPAAAAAAAVAIARRRFPRDIDRWTRDRTSRSHGKRRARRSRARSIFNLHKQCWPKLELGETGRVAFSERFLRKQRKHFAPLCPREHPNAF